MFVVILLCLTVAGIVVSTARWRVHPFLALLAAAFGFGLISGMDPLKVVDAVNQGFGSVAGGIGVVIVAGTIIGVILERSGGALALADAVLRRVGTERAPLAMSLIGYVVSIPVFCDSGFVILSPLMKAVAKRATVTLPSAAMALSLGLYASHTMVPPTPGPIAAAEILHADLGLVLLFGFPISAAAMLTGWLFARTLGRKRDGVEVEDLSDEKWNAALHDAPPAIAAFAPIAIPLVLILMGSLAASPWSPFGGEGVTKAIRFLGSPVVAILLGVAVAYSLAGRVWSRVGDSESGVMSTALNAAAVIILITCAGGAFGKVLQASGMADAIGGPLSHWRLGVLLPFILAAALKTAQGSSTVAIITTATLISPLMEALELASPAQTALTVVMIGAGSMVCSHANDSYFWVVTQFSNMSVAEGYRWQSLGSAIQGCAAGMLGWLISLAVV
ncbi:MAG: GntP family permease [bacterium]|nr:GntP family permease [bacterium]